MKSPESKISTVLLAALLLIAPGCPLRQSLIEVRYHLPAGFEGAVVIVFDQVDGLIPSLNGKEYVINVPDSGIVKVKGARKQFSGTPRFFYVDPEHKANQLEYLFKWKPPGSTQLKDFNDLTEGEMSNVVFAINYEKGNFGSGTGGIDFFSFLICKPKDGEYYAAVDLNRKLRSIVAPAL